MELTFGPDITEQKVMIIIIIDLRLEHDKRFNSFASLNYNITDPLVTLSPGQASINIIDNDGMLTCVTRKSIAIICKFTTAVVVIGFNQTLYEDVGQVIVNVEVCMGILRRPVVVFVFTANNAAIGEYYKIDLAAYFLIVITMIAIT